MSKRKSHVHDMEPIAAQRLVKTSLVNPLGIPPVTAVLWGCTRLDCWHVTATTLTGAWTLAQIRREPEPAKAPEPGD